MVQLNDKILYKILFSFAILDLVTGIISLFVNHIACQILALAITTITLIISIIYCVEHSKISLSDKKGDITTIIIGSLDFTTGLISVLVMILTTQILALVASGFTFFKALKIFIQSEKAQKILKQSTPLLLKIFKRIAPILGPIIINKLDTIKNKINDKEQISTMKEFFEKLGKVLKANLGTVGMVSIETICGSGSAVALVKHILGTGLINAAGSYAVGILIIALLYAGVVALTIWIGSDSEVSAKIRSLLSVLVKVIKNRSDEEKNAIIDTIVNDVDAIVTATKETIEAQEAEENAKAEAEAKAIAEQKALEKKQAEMMKKAQALLKQKEAEQAKAQAIAEAQALAAKKQAEKEAAEKAAAEKAAAEQAEIEALAAKIANGELAVEKEEVAIPQATPVVETQVKQNAADILKNIIKK